MEAVSLPVQQQWGFSIWKRLRSLSQEGSFGSLGALEILNFLGGQQVGHVTLQISGATITWGFKQWSRSRS